MRHPVVLTIAAVAAAGALALGARRALTDRAARAAEADLLAADPPAEVFSEEVVDGLPEPAQRYLLHAIAPGTPLAAACRLEMEGTMTPTPGGASTSLTATEVLAPRHGFVWTARARMSGLPVRVRDLYHANRGGVEVTALGAIPIPLGGPSADLTRSARGRLVAEAVWCPTALVHPCVSWEAVDADRARFTLAVDGVPVSVTLRVAEDGTLLDVAMERWGDVLGGSWQRLPYGFGVDEEATFGGVTIPTRLTGGWLYGTDRFDPASAASFSVSRLELAGTLPPVP